MVLNNRWNRKFIQKFIEKIPGKKTSKIVWFVRMCLEEFKINDRSSSIGKKIYSEIIGPNHHPWIYSIAFTVHKLDLKEVKKQTSIKQTDKIPMLYDSKEFSLITVFLIFTRHVQPKVWRHNFSEIFLKSVLFLSSFSGSRKTNLLYSRFIQ